MAVWEADMPRDIQKIKSDLRQKMRKKRESLTQSERRVRTEMIHEHLWGAKEFQEADCVHVFCSYADEVDTWPILKKILSQDKKLFCPKVEAKGQLEHYRVKDLSELKASKMGIFEPQKGESLKMDELDLVITPGLAFDRKGRRLGYGGGYYDEFLSQVDATSLGLCFEFQIIEDCPVSDNDESVSGLIFERGILSFKS